jgi:hypothetical protein
MARRFKRRRDGAVAITLEPFETALLRDCAEQLLDLLGPGDGPAGEDPLAAAFRHGPSEAPEDPALARLFPDAYGDGDDEARAASAEFRRFTENDLRSRKRSDALAVIASLDAAAAGRRGAEVLLDPGQCRQWLGALNDLRLTLASRLDLTAEGDDRALLHLPDDDPRKAAASVYFWLTWLQDTLVESMAS